MKSAIACVAPRLASVLSRTPCRRHNSLARPVLRTIAELLEWKPSEPVDAVVVNGFVRSVRPLKSNSFVALGDGSSATPLQAVVAPAKTDGLAVGAAVRLRGSWVPSLSKGQSHELLVSEVDVLGPSDASTFPLQKKYHTPEYLRTIPHLRPRIIHNAAMLQLRSVAIASLASFFASRAFTQTHTPIITSSDCEGAGEVFTLHPASQSPGAHQTDGAPAQHFFGKPKYLTVSAQLHLEALAQAVGNVWTLSPTFRAEKSDTSRHLSEFYMLEAEMSFVDHLGQVMDLAEDMLRTLGQDLHQSRVATDFLSPLRHTNPDRLGADEIKRRWGGLLQESWPRVTYTEAISILGRSPEPFTQKAIWGEGLQSEHERYLARFVGGGEKPVFVTHYPRDIKAFYMRGEPSRLSTVYDQEAPPAATVESFDLLVPDFCEMAGGSMREHRLEQLVAAMEARGLATRPTEATTAEGAAGSVPGVGADQAFYGTLEWYVDLRRWGCPPHGGFGLGFDRLLAYLSGVQTVRDAVAFPRWFSRCDC